MASYRFCRSDDVPLLVQAYNACFAVHFPGVEPLSVDGFKRRVREIDLWTSSCMVARSDDAPIGVLLAAKREHATLVHCLGVHPEHVRRGHGRHLLASLGAKLAILGPPRLTAEVSADRPAARAFLEACGFVRERTCTDFVLRARPARAGDAGRELVVAASVEELFTAGAIDISRPRCWERAPESLRRRGADLAALVVASDERVEAYVVVDGRGAEHRVLDHGCAVPARREAWLGLLLREIAVRDGRPVRLVGVSPEELPRETLRSWGFEAETELQAYGRAAERA
jgi:ribosomal protein S18 acetylase RimI-like enzyme